VVFLLLPFHLSCLFDLLFNPHPCLPAVLLTLVR